MVSRAAPNAGTTCASTTSAAAASPKRQAVCVIPTRSVAARLKSRNAAVLPMVRVIHRLAGQAAASATSPRMTPSTAAIAVTCKAVAPRLRSTANSLRRWPTESEATSPTKARSSPTIGMLKA
ncbi:MAG: hypothetical protein BWY52_03336 [Chloroflexi bacterium ADurb.Bin325]|nr:MAG: hypothetical protein BWY52_03336 [Chloroflexi bacterium ADurb.Bin325]